ncbi:MAG: murein biosynthesis integral membrane protein MurJ [Acidimicrobiia bacterium]
MSRPLRMGTAAAVVSASVLFSRLLGLGRESLLATMFGLEAEGDLYRQAFTIPDFLNYLLAGAYLTITLIPILSRHLERGQTEKASQAFTSVFRFVGWSVLGLTVVMWLAADPLVSLIFPDTSDHTRLVSLTRLVLPAQVFLVMGALLMAVQYTHRRFLLPALAPIFYNVGIIAGGVLGAVIGDASPEAFLWGAVVGSAVGNFGLQWMGARATETWLTPVPPGDSSVKEYLILALPLMLGQSIAVLDEQFVRWFGQIEVGATSALSFARQLNMVPVGVIAQAAGVAAFPFLARLAAADDEEGLARSTGRAARNTIFIAAAATATLIVLARPLVRLLYQYGEFDADDAELVANLLVIYAFSIPAWGLHQILSRHFYAKRKMWTVVGIGTAGTLIAVPVWLGLHAAIGVEGFALASTLVMTAYAIAMLVAWGLDAGWAPVRLLLPSLVRGLLAAGAAALVAYPLVRAFFGEGEMTIVGGLAAAALGALTTLAAFLGVSYLLRAPELGELRRKR